ncbi:CPBP family glutamic-type intramembrane protease [Spartinivicinus poritis]|uniref:CAAX prenyl protease 2/Lysostaphin resistance protein A-like domain-containing protein n=1 Tax=Spartinivicinus poritis TaxID=2994640 RepID=A0ABT5UIH7_9GAMM|nr:CPBP family glutamic-type intramembrane protease [Spartinivicinus sp. A2-2]MDE1466097.1 hypothetical protein [Spartinivicinus sp. A2-2]
MTVVLFVAVLTIPLFADLEKYYLTDPIEPLMWTIWVLAWLPGWELMHRVLLPIHLNRLLPGKGWLLIPVFEGAYHLVKPWPETLGMIVFSFGLTAWTVYRKNACLPILMHIFIEVFLGFYLYFYFSK